jgi:hypothetical protein
LPREFTIKLEAINEASVEYRRNSNRKVQKTIIFTLDAKRLPELKKIVLAIERDLAEEDEDDG